MLRNRIDTGLSERRGDWFFVVCFSLFAVSSLASDLPYALGGLDGGGPLAAGNRWYAAIAGDELFAAAPAFLRVRTGMSALLFGPFYVLLVWAVVRGAEWIRWPAIFGCGGIAVGCLEHLAWEFSIGPAPRHPAVFLAFNLPYAIVPALFAWRMRHAAPFADRFPTSSITAALRSRGEDDPLRLGR